MSRSSIVLAFVALSLLASGAAANDGGMFLSRSPVVANDLWTDITTAQQAGLKLNREMVARIAAKNDCPFVASDHLKPIDFVAGQLAITDGKVKGWSSPQLYIHYVTPRETRVVTVAETLA
jgi:hypothetical protein